MVLMGLLAMLLAACGRGTDTPAVTEGLEGLDQISSRAAEGLRTVVPKVVDATGASAAEASGSYVESGYSGTTLLYGYRAESVLTGADPIDIADVRGALEDAGLSAEVVDQPGGAQGITANGSGYVVLTRLDATGTELTVTAQSSGAQVEQSDLSPDDRAALREPTPIDLG